MLVPPTSLPGWKVFTVGDDIAWLRPGEDGRLWAVNPEAGFFGVVPGTSRKTNPNALEMIQRNTIYTNVALRPDGTPWWEGHDDPPPAEALDWQGRPWTPQSSGEGGASEQPLHDAGRASARRSSPECDNPDGVPIDAILFGARRQRARAARVRGARLAARHVPRRDARRRRRPPPRRASVGVLRRDPMAMLPVLRLQHGRLLRALARRWAAR